MILFLFPMSRKSRAQNVIRQHMLYSLATGFIPIPLVDIGATTWVQMRMLKKLCEIYDQPFEIHQLRALISALTTSLAARMGASLLKAIPGVGSIGGGLSMGVLSAALTYALGDFFVFHFEQGGTLENVNIEQGKAYIESKLKEGVEKAKTMDNASNIKEKLQLLKELKEEGLITEEEYEKKRKQLIEQL